MKMREENQDNFQSKFGVKLGIMSFFIKASVIGLKKFPIINAEIEDDTVLIDDESEVADFNSLI